MRISDWSSDVCSSDLTSPVENHPDSASGKQGTASSGRFTPRHPESARTLVHMGTGKRGCCESCGWILRLGEAGGARSESICWQSRAWRLNPAFCPYNNYHHHFIKKTLLKLSCSLHPLLRPSAHCR